MSERFSSAKFHLRGANHAYQRLCSLITEYSDSGPCRFEVDTYDNGVRSLKAVLGKDDLPDPLRFEVANCVDRLRAALDTLAFACAEAAGQPPSAKVYFPFGATEADVKKGSKYLPDEINGVFLSFRPFKEGDYDLWRLNRLVNNQKHRQVEAIITGVEGVSFNTMSFYGGRFFTMPEPMWNPITREFVFAKAWPDAEFEVQGLRANLMLRLSSDDGSGLPLVDYFERMLTKVAQIISDTEKKAGEIGLIVTI